MIHEYAIGDNKQTNPNTTAATEKGPVNNADTTNKAPPAQNAFCPNTCVCSHTVSSDSVHGVRIPKKNMRFILGSIVPIPAIIKPMRPKIIRVMGKTNPVLYRIRSEERIKRNNWTINAVVQYLSSEALKFCLLTSSFGTAQKRIAVPIMSTGTKKM